MNEHDARILGPKAKARKDRDVLQEFADSHPFCACCGDERKALHIHHLIGGRGGRSDESVNLLRLCFRPCHDLADGLDVFSWTYTGVKGYMPKLPLAVQLSIKIRAGELTSEGLERLAVLHGRTLPEPQPIPQFFVDLWRKNGRA